MKTLSNQLLTKFDSFNVVNKYVNENKTMQEIANELNVGAEAIRIYLHIKNVKIRKAIKRKEIREIPPIGKKFGLWTIVSDEIKTGKDRSLYWLCKCECGELSWKKATVLKLGLSTRCKKCGNKILLKTNNKINAFIKYKYNQIKRDKSHRKKVSKLPFTITEQDLQDLYNLNPNCSLSGISLAIDFTKSLKNQNLSVDRIDSNKGYEKDNIQLVDKRINMMKQSLNNQEFIDLCCKVAEQHGYVKYDV